MSDMVIGDDGWVEIVGEQTRGGQSLVGRDQAFEILGELMDKSPAFRSYAEKRAAASRPMINRVPLQKALQVTERVAAGALREALARVAARVREGHSLGAALEAESGLFSPVTVGLVRAGERGGGLAAALAQAAAQLERQDETVARVRAALAYPAILAVVGALSIVLMVLVVVPRFVALLGDTGAALPPATRLLLGMSTLARSHGALLLGGLAGAGVVAATFFGRHRSAWRSWALELPVAGRIRHGLATARVCRTLAALLG